MTEKIKEKFTYGYSSENYKKFKKYAFLTLLSFSFTYLFFYNGRSGSYFGFLKEEFGWSAIFITIGCLYVILLLLTLQAKKMNLKRL